MRPNVFDQLRTFQTHDLFQTWRLWKHQHLLQAQPVPPALQPASRIWICLLTHSVLATLLSTLWTQHSTVSCLGFLAVSFFANLQTQLFQCLMLSILSYLSGLLIASCHLSFSLYQLLNPVFPTLLFFSPLSLLLEPFFAAAATTPSSNFDCTSYFLSFTISSSFSVEPHREALPPYSPVAAIAVAPAAFPPSSTSGSSAPPLNYFFTRFSNCCGAALAFAHDVALPDLLAHPFQEIHVEERCNVGAV